MSAEEYKTARTKALAKRYDIGGVIYRIKPPSIKVMAEMPREINAIIGQLIGDSKGKDGKVTIDIDVDKITGALREIAMERLPNLLAMAIIPEGKTWTPQLASDTAQHLWDCDIELDLIAEISLDFIDSSPVVRQLLSRAFRRAGSKLMSTMGAGTEILQRMERIISTYVPPSATETPSDTPPSSTSSPTPSDGSSADGSATSGSERKPTTK